MPPAARRLVDLLWPALGLGLLALGWALIAAISGPFVLPSLADTGAAIVRLVGDGRAGRALAVTLLHAVGGATLGSAIGFGLGLAGGLVRPLGASLAAPVTAILGVPPVAWIVLAFLWFGTGPAAPLFTVSIAAAPIVFLATRQGVVARDPLLTEMARAFRLPPATRFVRILMPGLAVHLAPALSTTFALSWKVALTAEVLGDGSGVGGAFATARAHLDLAEAMAWIVLVVVVLLAGEALPFSRLLRRLAAPDGPAPATDDGAGRC